MGLNETFKDKTVLVTGHTGFKGSWLALWLQLLGAKVVGYSLQAPTTPSHYDQITKHEISGFAPKDIRSYNKLVDCVVNTEPDFIFHLAAQPIVKFSYEEPRETWDTNLMGTINLLEAVRNLRKSCNIVFVTSDKAYDNVEWVWGYREIDKLGGPDPYSASKGAAEIAIRSYYLSFFAGSKCNIRLASARAGNVIGGGDWAPNRIVPDCMNAWSNDQEVLLRNPFATRPWQHVLEPLSGYLSLAKILSERQNVSGEAFNFGPATQHSCTVLELVNKMSSHWPRVRWQVVEDEEANYESTLLKLNSDKASHLLGWQATLDLNDTVEFTVDWYKNYYEGQVKPAKASIDQINTYIQKAHEKGLLWAN